MRMIFAVEEPAFSEVPHFSPLLREAGTTNRKRGSRSSKLVVVSPAWAGHRPARFFGNHLQFVAA